MEPENFSIWQSVNTDVVLTPSNYCGWEHSSGVLA